VDQNHAGFGFLRAARASYIRRHIHRITLLGKYPGCHDRSNAGLRTEYYRQGAACLALAQLTDISSIKVRWLRMARTWFTLAEKTIEAPVAASSVKSDAPNVIQLCPIRGGSLSDRA